MTPTKPVHPHQKNIGAPLWAQELEEKYQSGIAHAFLIHGNVQDVVSGEPGLFLRDYLISSFKRRDLTVSWNRATGLTLPTKDQREQFVQIVDFPIPGSNQNQPARPGSLAAGLNAASSSPSTDLAKLLEKVRNPGDALDYINRMLRARVTKRNPRTAVEEPQRYAVIVDYAESIAPASDAAAAENDRAALVVLSEWGRDPRIGENHILILIASNVNDVNERLRKSGVRWEQIEIPFPGFDERVSFFQRLLSDNTEVKLAPGTTYEELARLTTGLRFIDLEDIVLRANFLQADLSYELVKARKDEIMASEFDEVLSVGDAQSGFESIGGMQEVKDDLHETVITPMRNGQLRLVPQGLLFMGPAGTGKTRLARALAKEAGFTFVELMFSKIFGKWVGSTERSLEKAFNAIKSMTPCLVFIDEIDQSVSRGESGDNGVSNRVFKRLMEFMSDTTLRGRVLIIAATNRPDLLDPALLRPGRLDKKIPILAPDARERTAILEVLTLSAFGEDAQLPTQEQYQGIADQMVEYTGAEIEAVVGKAMSLRLRHPEYPVFQLLASAYERLIPSTQNIELMTRLALLHCNDLDLVPSQYREMARSLRHPAARRELLSEVSEEENTPTPRRKREF